MISRWRSMHKYNLQLFLNSRNYNSSFVSFLKQVLSLLVNNCNLSYCSSNEGGFSNEEFLHQEIRVLWVNNPPLFSLSFYLDCLFPIDVIMEMKTLQYFTLLIGNEVIITQVAFLLLSHSVLGRVSERMWWPNDIATGHCTNFPKSNEAISLLSLSGCRFVEALGRFTFSGGIWISILVKLYQNKMKTSHLSVKMLLVWDFFNLKTLQSLIKKEKKEIRLASKQEVHIGCIDYI